MKLRPLQARRGQGGLLGLLRARGQRFRLARHGWDDLEPENVLEAPVAAPAKKYSMVRVKLGICC